MATERRAEVTWRGDLLSGAGTIERVGSGAFGPLDVTWASRAEAPDGRTSPEELIAAAHERDQAVTRPRCDRDLDCAADIGQHAGSALPAPRRALRRAPARASARSPAAVGGT